GRELVHDDGDALVARARAVTRVEGSSSRWRWCDEQHHERCEREHERGERSSGDGMHVGPFRCDGGPSTEHGVSPYRVFATANRGGDAPGWFPDSPPTRDDPRLRASAGFKPAFP